MPESEWMKRQGSDGTTPCRAALLVEQCWHEVPGGTAGAAVDLLRSFQGREDIIATAISARHSEPPDPAYRPPVDVLALPLTRQVLYQAWSRSSQPSIDRFVAGADLIHATGGIVPPTHRPLVVTQHDLAWLHHPELFTKHGVRFFRRTLSRTAERATIVICPSKATAADLSANGIDNAKIRIIPWGVDQASASPTDVEQVRRRFDLGGRYVLSVGTLEPRKNLRRLVAAFAKAAPADVSLAIVGPSGWQQDIESLIAPLGDRAKRLGFLSRSDLVALYSGATLFAYPSLFEGFGLPVLEAMVQGAPVLTSRGTATEELVGECALLVDPYDVDSISEALGDLLVGSSAVDSLGELGRQRARSYTWTRTADQTIAAYEQALA